ncbi:hypothetical protein [Shimazuella kribbensis]|uniref:hypothetical protein n=1 Tax=Shimazuella kribbensis TaxID=139808 RepID=UPI00042A49C0|nr:hypothetical protein [Shimazuella kribbensis]
MKKRTALDIIVLGIVVVIALIVVSLSFQNTTKLSGTLGLNPYLTAGLVEILFASLLFIRGKQRALQRNVPIFLELGYFISLGFVTAVNMYGLAQTNALIGSIVGLTISGAMWLMENTLVWLWTRSHEPHVKSIRERMLAAKKVIQEEKVIQKIEWMKWEARKPDLRLIKVARREEEQRKKIIGEGLPEYFRQEPEPLQEIVITPVIEDNQSGPQETHVIPFKRQIGFYQEEKQQDHLFQANTEARIKAIQTAKELTDELGRFPTYKEMKNKGITTHYSRIAFREIKNG